MKKSRLKKSPKRLLKKSKALWVLVGLGLLVTGAIFSFLKSDSNLLSFLGIPLSINRVADFDDPLATGVVKEANDKANQAATKEAKATKDAKDNPLNEQLQKKAKEAEAELYIAAKTASLVENIAVLNPTKDGRVYDPKKSLKVSEEAKTEIKTLPTTDISNVDNFKKTVTAKLEADGIVTKVLSGYEKKKSCPDPEDSTTCKMVDDLSKPLYTYTVKPENQAIINAKVTEWKIKNGGSATGGVTTPVDPSIVTPEWCKGTNSGTFGCPYTFSWVGDEKCGNSVAGYYCWEGKLYVINLPDTQNEYNKRRAEAEGKLGEYIGDGSEADKKRFLNSLGIYDTATIKSLSAKLKAKTTSPGGNTGSGTTLTDAEKAAQELADKKQACEAGGKKFIGSSCISSVELGRLVHSCEETTGKLFDLTTGKCGGASTAIATANSKILNQPTTPCKDGQGTLGGQDVWITCAMNGKGGTSYKFCSQGKFKKDGSCELSTIDTPQSPANNLTPDQKDKLNKPNEPWGTNNPVLVKKKSECPENSTSDSVYLPGDTGATIRCFPPTTPANPAEGNPTQLSSYRDGGQEVLNQDECTNGKGGVWSLERSKYICKNSDGTPYNAYYRPGGSSSSNGTKKPGEGCSVLGIFSDSKACGSGMCKWGKPKDKSIGGWYCADTNGLIPNNIADSKRSNVSDGGQEVLKVDDCPNKTGGVWSLERSKYICKNSDNTPYNAFYMPGGTTSTGSNQPQNLKAFGETCDWNGSCESSMCSLKTHNTKGSGWYCLNEVNKSDLKLKPGVLTDDQSRCEFYGIETGFVTHSFLLQEKPIYKCQPSLKDQQSSLNTTSDPTLTTPQLSLAGTPALNTGPLTPNSAVTNPAGQPAVNVPPYVQPGSAISGTPVSLTTNGTGRCQRVSNSYCDGQRMDELYRWYKSHKEGWWYKQLGPNEEFTPAHFLGVMLIAETTGNSPKTLEVISLAVSNQLWGTGVHTPYCTKQADAQTCPQNFLGAYVQSAGERYNNLILNPSAGAEYNVINEDKTNNYIKIFADNGLTIDTIADKTVNGQAPREINYDTPMHWGAYPADPDLSWLGKPGCKAYYQDQSEVVYSLVPCKTN